MSQPPQRPYDPTQYFAAKSGEDFRGVLPSHDTMGLGDWDVDGMSVIEYRKWSTNPVLLEPQHSALDRTKFMSDPARQQWPIAEWGDSEADTDA